MECVFRQNHRRPNHHLVLYITEIITYEYLQAKKKNQLYLISFLSTDYHTPRLTAPSKLDLALPLMADLMNAYVSLFQYTYRYPCFQHIVRHHGRSENNDKCSYLVFGASTTMLSSFFPTRFYQYPFTFTLYSQEFTNKRREILLLNISKKRLVLQTYEQKRLGA